MNVLSLTEVLRIIHFKRMQSEDHKIIDEGLFWF